MNIQTYKEVAVLVLEAWAKSINNGKMDRDVVRMLRNAWRTGPPDLKPALENLAELYDVNLMVSDAIEMRDRLMEGLRSTSTDNGLAESIGVMYRDLDSLVNGGLCSAMDAMRLGMMMGKLEDRVALGINGKVVTERQKGSHE